MQIVGKKLDDITVKLDSVANAVAMLVNELQKTNQELGENAKKLSESVEHYADAITQRSLNDFEQSKNNIMKVSTEITNFSRMTGSDQIVRINQSLNAILAVLEKAINPDQIQSQLFEITQFIKNQGGGK